MNNGSVGAQEQPLPLSPARPARRRLSGGLVSWAPVLALAALVAGFSLAQPQFIGLANLHTLTSQAAIPVILVTGMTFVILQGSIDLSVEGVMAACSLTFALLVHNSRTGLDLGVVAILAGLLLGGGFGCISGLLVTRLKVPSFMVTLGMWSVSGGIAMLESGGQPPQILDLQLRGWALGDTLGIPHLAYIAVAFLAAGQVLQSNTRFGRYSYVVGCSEPIARLSGIRVDRFKVLAFAFAGLSAGLAAVLESARLGVGHVEIGANQLFVTLTAVVIGGTSLAGGRGGVMQSFVGVLILTVLSNGMIFVGVTPYLQTAMQGLIILVAVIATNWHSRDRLKVVK
ncbi:ABC transporter permease [Mesorhizobium sp. B3-1-6]|uniref:ABC transporter permease n=1 Tax=Mesorhizobium sp. B3-1-6 TaxID=2589895 RepID=UPI001AEDC9C2|nr:ABC transporter permease [Mesorhizobium sp. B3-1-6]